MTDYMTASQLAAEVGVTRQRIRQLVKQGRICGVRRVRVGKRERVLVPFNTRILRARNPRPGKTTDYIRRWEKTTLTPREKRALERDPHFTGFLAGWS